jgi:hypothetical protein
MNSDTMKWITLVGLVIVLLFAVVDNMVCASVSPSFFVNADGSQNSLIIVGEHADASDIIEASQLACTIGELSVRERKVPVVEEVDISYDNVTAGTCIVITPSELPTLWYFDDFGVYGNGNNRFDSWEQHQEIQLYIEDIRDFDPFFHSFIGNGYLDFSTILRIDNVRSPPQMWVDSFSESPGGKHITGLQYQRSGSHIIVDPYFVYYGLLPEIELFGKLYTVLYINSGQLITGIPHLEYVYVYEDQPFEAGEFTISLLDVDVDYNKVHLRVQGPGIGETFWMVLDPEHGFSSNVQKMGADEVIALDYDGDGIIEYFEKEVVGQSELDVWGHSGIADLVIDGIKTFIGEKMGVYLGVYWVEDMIRWGEKTCCDPFVIYPQEYNFQIRPETVTAHALQDAYVDQVLPPQNFGGSPSLFVRSSLNANKRTFVKFDLPVLPSEAIVSSAVLRLVPVSVPDSRNYEVSRVTGPWDESTVTWATQPAAVSTGTQINNLMEWNVTSDVQNFYSGTPNYGWRISDQNEDSAVPYEIIFGSRESSARPQLILEYTFDCNYTSEGIPHIPNWVGSFYDDVTNDGVPDAVYEIDISLCEPIRTICDPLFFEGPNYYYYVDFWNTSFEDGVDFRVYQRRRAGTYTVENIIIEPWELVKLDAEVMEEDGIYNWILVGGVSANSWVKHLVDEDIVPDDSSPLDWFMKGPGYKMYSDPFGLRNKILVVAGRTSKETQEAIRKLIEEGLPSLA